MPSNGIFSRPKEVLVVISLQPWSARFLIFLAFGLVPICHGGVEAATLKLSWKDSSTNESGFKVERLSGASYVEIASVGANVQTYTDSGLTSGSTYCYRVRAFNSSGSSGTTNAACATAPIAALPGLPQNPAPSSPQNPPSNPDPSGTAQLGGRWGDYQVTMKISSADNDVLGVMFRYQDNDNYYRFSWFNEGKYRRLEKRVGGNFQLLAQDSVPYTVGQNYALQIIARGSSLQVLIDGKSIFAVTDATFSEGTIALYSHYNVGSSFDNVLVDDLTAGNILLSANFNNGTHPGWTFVDDGTDLGPSQWSAATGALVQSSNIGSADPGRRGTYALYTRGSWKDYRVTLKLRSTDNDRLGVIFRFQDPGNYYRFSWNQGTPGRRLIKRDKGIQTIIAEDAVPYVTGQTYQIEIVAQGSTLKVNIDGQAVFAASDQSFPTGTVALYSSYNQGSVFDDVLVEDLAKKSVLLWDDFNNGKLSGWTVIDDKRTDSGPSAWSVINGELLQTSNIGSDSTGHPGTFLLY